MHANLHYKLFNDTLILENYSGIYKIEDMETYSSDVAEKISKDELKEKIKNSNLI